MQAATDRMLVLVEQRGERLPQRRAVRAVARAVRQQCQQRALQLLLQVDDRDITLAPQIVAKGAELAPRRRRERTSAPASQRDRNHAAHARMQRHQRREGLLGDPVDGEFRPVAADVVDQREGVHDVAERRGPDDEDRAHGDGR